jgi:pimeloyl-ACP methyl ester carboxylesterase
VERLIARFGAPDREMLGMLSLPPASPWRGAWLLCNPFGQEAVRSKQAYRVLAERLAREGCAVLRFDFHGTGDSPGELADQSLAGWITDLLAADAWLRTRLQSSSVPVHWFGLRLGASLAALAAGRAAPSPRELLLWDPITNGAQYGHYLLKRHREEMCKGLGMNWVRLRRETGEPEPALPGSVLGFDIGPLLAADLAALGEPPLAALLDKGIRIGVGLEPQRLAHQQVPHNANLERIAIESHIDWNTSDGLGTAIAPQDMQRAVFASVTRQ